MAKHKRVLLIVVDGWTPRVLQPAVERGELPLLAELASRGWLALDCVSIFPSITPAATASIVTGEYPSGHGISGMSWWNPSTGDVSYYGDDVWTILQRGPGDFLRDFLLNLNGDRLKAPTIFQLAERQQHRAACFNHLIFRGDQPHEVTHPWLLRLFPSVGSGVTVHGPSWLCLGDFVSSAGGPARDVDAPGGVFNRFGLDDEGTEALLRDIPDARSLPDVTVAYFADYDFDSHDEGPEDAVSTLRTLDDRLSRIFSGWGGLDRVLGELCIVMTADHGHSLVGRDDRSSIELQQLLKGYRTADPASGWENGDELLVCPNMRATEVFHRNLDPGYVADLAARLLEDDRVDHVIWREDRPGSDNLFHVRQGRDELRFRPVKDTRSSGGRADARSGADRVVDEYGGRWELTGEPRVLDMTVRSGRVQYGEYPNALERITGGIEHPRVGRLLVTAKPGYEFAAPGQGVHHGAGSHGTLHAEDSRVPLLIAGAPGDAAPDGTPRIVDVVPICSEVLPLEFGWRTGDSRAVRRTRNT